MAKIITMPKLGLTMTKGKIGQWYKQENDEVKAGEKLFSVETDKLTNDVEAKEDGILRKIIVQAGEDSPCLEPVAIIGTKDEDISEILSEKNTEAKQEKTAEVPEKEKSVEGKRSIENHGERIKISPIARKLALEEDVRIESIKGTGPNGRIVLKDVEDFIANGNNVKITPAANKVAKGLGINPSEINSDKRIRTEDIYRFAKSRNLEEIANPTEKRIPMSTMRKVIAERMSYSYSTAPVVHYNIKVDVTKLKELRESLKPEIHLSFTDLIIRLVSQALLDNPLLNSSIEGEEIILRNYVNMGVAVALEDGLIVPVIRHSHMKGLKEISKDLKDLTYKAKNNQLSSEEVTGGTFTITNIGMFGVESFTPIINQPESAILGINSIVDTLELVNGNVVKKPLMNLSLTADHRNIDGAVAAQFLASLKQYMENPARLLL